MAGRRRASAPRGGSAAPSAGPVGGRGAGPVGRRGADREAGPDADPESVARLICLRLLTAAPRTRAELAAALQRRGVPDEAASAVLARFAEVKLIDDAMFARAWVDSRHHGRGLASRALGAELRQRGVPQDDIQAALGELSPDVELETARELVARRLPGTAGMPLPARMRRLVGVCWPARATARAWRTESSGRLWKGRPETTPFPAMNSQNCLSRMTRTRPLRSNPPAKPASKIICTCLLKSL